jgi:hypothetical protein
MRILIRTKDTEDWQLVKSAPYDREAELQALLAKSPSLIPVDELREGASPFVLAVPEFGLPGSGQTDLLAVTSGGDLAVVECKLSANPEIKRTVVAQVLEYAAYLWEMSYEEMNARVQARLGEDLAGLISRDLDDADWDEGEFRSNVSQSLRDGTFMLIIAVDEVNDELKRTIRFLNSCGDPKFSFHALEMRRFKRGDVDVLVPHTYGAAVAPPPPPRRHVDRPTFLAACTSIAAGFFEGLLQAAHERKMIVYWGTVGFSIRMPLDPAVTVMLCYPPQRFDVYTSGWPLDEQELSAFLEKLHGIAPFQLRGDYTHCLQVTDQTHDAALAALKPVWELVNQMMSASGAPGP